MEVRRTGEEVGMNAPTPTPNTQRIDVASDPQKLLAFLPPLRDSLRPRDFHSRLRDYLLLHPTLTLRQVAQSLSISRQAVSNMVGRLDRLTCAAPNRPAPKTDHARANLKALAALVAQGRTAQQAADQLGVSLSGAVLAGFRVKAIRKPHGKGREGCGCWRCRRAAGLAVPRGTRTRMDAAATLDWLAWNDPDDGRFLSQKSVAALSGTRQQTVSRLARSI